MSIPAKKTLITFLRDSKLKVTFKKVNGDERVMECTLQKDIVPKHDTDRKDIDHNTIIVWDLEKSAWRSFKYDNLISVTTLTGEKIPTQ